jgi:hypothetical protein
MKRRAFTLLEMVLGLALVAALLGAMIGFVWNLLDRRETLVRGARDVQAGCAIVERMESDLVAGLAGDGGMGAGVVGDATKLKLLSRGVWLAVEGSDAARAAHRDLQGTEYAFDAASGKLTARRFSGSSGQGTMEVLSDRVHRVRLRYYDGRAWRTSFDSLREGGLPVAIEVAVWFTGLGNETTAVASKDGQKGSMDDADASKVESKDANQEKKWGEPDRLRVIVVPDGPEAGWKEGA